MPLPHFRLRTAMFAVAAVGLALGFLTCLLRSREYARLARSHEATASVTSRGLLVQRHRALAERYRRAARYPWLRVEPDLP
jgi:hypothetical protein